MSADGTLPPDVLHLYFSNDNKYVDCDTDNVIYEHLRLLSVMPPTHWSAVEALYLQELPDRSSSSTSSTLTYTTFASALLNSLARAERHWEDVLKQPFKLELSTLVLHGHDSPPLLGNPRSLSARYFQHAMATIAAGLSAPVNSLVLIDLTTSLTTLKMLASSCSMLQLWNVRMERKGPRALTRHATDITTSRVIEQPCLTRLWLDEDSLATFFMALAPPCNNLRTLRLTVGENASEIFNQDLQGILDEAAETLEELHYEPYWTKYGPNEDNGGLLPSSVSSCIEWLTYASSSRGNGGVRILQIILRVLPSQEAQVGGTRSPFLWKWPFLSHRSMDVSTRWKPRPTPRTERTDGRLRQPPMSYR